MKITQISTAMFTLVVSFVLVQAPLITSAHAEMISTSEVVRILNQDQNRQKVADYLQREEVKNEMTKMGVNPEEAQSRVASLSDEEVQQISGQIDQAVAGGDVIVVSLTTVLLVVIILLLLKVI